MRVRYAKTLVVSLLLISSQIALAQKTTSLDLNNPEIQRQIADELVDLEVCQKSLDTTTRAYNDCAQDTHGALGFWQTPEFVIGGFVVTVSATAGIICLLHVMGACK